MDIAEPEGPKHLATMFPILFVRLFKKAARWQMTEDMGWRFVGHTRTDHMDEDLGPHPRTKFMTPHHKMEVEQRDTYG